MRNRRDEVERIIRDGFADDSDHVVAMETVTLEPCPFCGDPMQVKHGTLKHIEQGECVIGVHGWDVSFAPKWNRRAALEAVSSIHEADHPGPASDERVEAATIAGWNACRKSIYAVCEVMIERQYNPARAVPLRGLPTPTQEAHSRGFYAGGKDAAKSIARGFNSMEARDDDHFREVVAEQKALANLEAKP